MLFKQGFTVSDLGEPRRPVVGTHHAGLPARIVAGLSARTVAVAVTQGPLGRSRTTS